MSIISEDKQMKEYLVCEIAYSYGISLCKARRFTEEEKNSCADWFKDRAFSLISDSPNIKLKYISWDDVYKILNERDCTFTAKIRSLM